MSKKYKYSEPKAVSKAPKEVLIEPIVEEVIEKKEKVVEEKPVKEKKVVSKVKKYTFKVMVCVNYLNVRSGSSMNSPVVRVAKNYDIFEIEEVKSNWGKIADSTEWICLDFAKRI